MKNIECSRAGVCDNSTEVHLATDAFLAVLDSIDHSKAALELSLPFIDWHVYITRAQTEAAKPDSAEWLITFLNMSACVARLCTVEAEAGPEEAQPKPFRAALLESNTLEVVCDSILQAIEVTHHALQLHAHVACNMYADVRMLTFTGSRRPGLVMTYIAIEALVLLCTFR